MKKSIVLMGILLIILLGVAVALGYAGMKCQNENADLRGSNKMLEEENTALKSEIQDLQKQVDSLDEEVKTYREQEAERKEAEAASELLSTIENLEPGTIVEESQVAEHMDAYFQKYEICIGDEVHSRINGKSYRENNNIGLDDLRYLKVLHYNFQHQIQVGEIIVNAAISDDVLNIFRELFDAEYEVQSMYLIDNYWTGDGGTSDTASIDVNNTSAFNYREVTGGGSLSNHAYGCAIDINPQQNPYVWYSGGEKRWTHENASAYIDRTSGDPHMIVRGDICFSIFEKYGFSWGGDWSNPIDYQHFEKKVMH